ncbi:MAG: response regulator [Methylobacteriaceae bacterium]|nr:response regulator [Methylobacteriaceae bacterium]
MSGEGRGGPILFVEDELLVAEVIMEELKEEGFAVRHATTGEEATRLIDAGEPVGLLFTDIRLPGGMDGWAIAEHLRARGSTAPVVYATGFSGESPSPVENSRLVRKPYRVSQLLATFAEMGYAASA